MAVGNSSLVDFHFHTNYSDGSENVANAVKEARERGIIALALTDHNDHAGVDELTALCRQKGLGYLEGTEIYAAFPLDQPWSQDPKFCGPIPDLTILGKGLDWPVFEEQYATPLMAYWQKVFIPETLKKLQESGLVVASVLSRKEWQGFNEAIAILHLVINNPTNWPRIHEISQEFKPDITLEEVQKAPVRWANRYLFASGTGAYVLRGPGTFTVSYAVELAHEMGGPLFAAHPGGEYANWSQDHLNYFIDQGGDGLEVWQYFHSDAQIRQFLELALQHNLVVSGGSDWHGKNGRPTLGCWDKPNVQTPSWVFEQLMDRLP